MITENSSLVALNMTERVEDMVRAFAGKYGGSDDNMSVIPKIP